LGLPLRPNCQVSQRTGWYQGHVERIRLRRRRDRALSAVLDGKAPDYSRRKARRAEGSGEVLAGAVSTTRQGVIATKTRETDDEVASKGRSASLRGDDRPWRASLSAAVGCQYNGAGQFFSGTISRNICALSAIGRRTKRGIQRDVIGCSFRSKIGAV
jgi:hypothetical protein